MFWKGNDVGVEGDGFSHRLPATSQPEKVFKALMDKKARERVITRAACLILSLSLRRRSHLICLPSIWRSLKICAACDREVAEADEKMDLAMEQWRDARVFYHLMMKTAMEKRKRIEGHGKKRWTR